MLVGVLGGGQLGRMLALAGYPLGLRFRFLDPSPDAPAGQVGELITGAYSDQAALAWFARGLDAATFEFENVPGGAVAWLGERVPTFPGVRSLEAGQDRANEKALCARLGLATPEFAVADTKPQFDAAVGMVGIPAIAKTRRLGYDGKGQAVIRDIRGVDAAWATLAGAPAIVERLVEFERELSIIAVRGHDGAERFYPLTENEHRGGMLRRSRVPAGGVTPGLQRRAEHAASLMMRDLAHVGVLAVEFFQVGIGSETRLLVNEIAPRVHNSGHWTIDGAVTSQFENHLRAGLKLPLGPVGARDPAVMLNIVGGVPSPRDVLACASDEACVRLHLYGKDARPGRKLGHVTITGPSQPAVDAVVARVEALVRAHEA